MSRPVAVLSARGWSLYTASLKDTPLSATIAMGASCPRALVALLVSGALSTVSTKATQESSVTTTVVMMIASRSDTDESASAGADSVALTSSRHRQPESRHAAITKYCSSVTPTGPMAVGST